MPILVKDFSWVQNENSIIIRLHYKRGYYDKVDIFGFDNYIKVNFYPYLCEIFLMSPVDHDKSKCIVNEDDIVLELRKTEPLMWDTLEKALNKDEKAEIRQRAIDKCHQETKVIREKKELERDRLHKECVKEQIALDSKEREKITELKKNATDAAMKELEEWKTSVKKDQISNNKEDLSKMPPKEKQKSESRTINSTEGNLKIKNKNDVKIMPSVRKQGSIEVKFSAREFPTPSRESQTAEEQEWLQKQVEARRKAGFIEEDLKEEEKDPVWLKRKGDSFFQVKNYLGAVSAYSFAITKLGSKLPGLYINRSAAHMALGNLHKTIDDCSQALELLTPCVPQNLESRARCYARRGAAFFRLGLKKPGLVDLETALALRPNDEKLKSDVETARNLIKE